MSNEFAKRRRIRQLALARALSAAGSQAAQVAVVYQVYALTRSGAWVLGAVFVSLSAGALLAPLSGWIADHFERRRVMIASELAGGGVYLVMVFAHSPWWLLTGAFFATVLGAPFRAASVASVPNLVEPHDVAWANGMLATAFNVALVSGPIIGGAVVAASGASTVFALNAASFLLSALLIGLTSGRFSSISRGERIEEAGARRLFDGFVVLVRVQPMTSLAVASALAYSSFGAALVIDPALAHAFGAGSVGYGLLTAVWGGGAVLGSIVAGRTTTVQSAPRAITLGMLAMAVSLGSIVFLPDFGLIVAAGSLGGAGSGFVFVPWIVLIQHHTADAVRARVVAAAEALDQVALVGGMAITVPVIAAAGAQSAYGFTGALLGLATIVAAGASRTIKRSAPSRQSPVWETTG